MVRFTAGSHALRIGSFAFIAFSFIFNFKSLNAEVIAVPRLESPVMDLASMMSPQESRHLLNILELLHNETDVQMAFLTVSSLNGEAIEQTSIRVADQWKLGSGKTDRGILVLIAKNDRKMRIEVGQGLEGDLTDAYSKRVIDLMTPFMKEQQFGTAFIVGALEIIKYIEPQLHQKLSELKPLKRFQSKDHKRKKSSVSGIEIDFPSIIFYAIIILLVMIPEGSGRRRRRWSSSRGWSSSSSSSSRSSSSSSGGFSGGGGGFSGGGSSGSW